MKYTCWLEEENDAGDDRRTREIEDLDEDYAAAQMCEALEQDGEWSGDPIPHVVIVFVQEESGDRNLFRAEVEHEYSVSFYAPWAVTLVTPERPAPTTCPHGGVPSLCPEC